MAFDPKFMPEAVKVLEALVFSGNYWFKQYQLHQTEFVSFLQEFLNGKEISKIWN